MAPTRTTSPAAPASPDSGPVAACSRATTTRRIGGLNSRLAHLLAGLEPVQNFNEVTGAVAGVHPAQLEDAVQSDKDRPMVIDLLDRGPRNRQQPARLVVVRALDASGGNMPGCNRNV